MILCDTNIFIEFYRNNEDVINELQNIGVSNLSVSAITIGELYFGARDRRELLKIKKTPFGIKSNSD
jgi:predicted nucleic acid-binding protein